MPLLLYNTRAYCGQFGILMDFCFLGFCCGGAWSEEGVGVLVDYLIWVLLVYKPFNVFLCSCVLIFAYSAIAWFSMSTEVGCIWYVYLVLCLALPFLSMMVPFLHRPVGYLYVDTSKDAWVSRTTNTAQSTKRFGVYLPFCVPPKLPTCCI